VVLQSNRESLPGRGGLQDITPRSTALSRRRSLPKEVSHFCLGLTLALPVIWNVLYIDTLRVDKSGALMMLPEFGALREGFGGSGRYLPSVLLTPTLSDLFGHKDCLGS
jgi:hypothetical protein